METSRRLEKKGFKVNLKNEEKTISYIPMDEKDSLDSKLEMLKFLTEVQSRIKTEITEDFVLAKLEPKDKEGIIEMTSNAFYCKRIMVLMEQRSNENRYKWDNEKKEWIKETLTQDEINVIKIQASQMFDTFMNRLFMTVILNRNVERNPLLRLISNSTADEKEEFEQQQPEKISAFQNLVNKLKPSEKTEE